MPATTNVLDLVDPLDGGQVPAYVAIYSENESSNSFALSPSAMRWSKTIIIVKLTDCVDFWLSQKKKLRCKLLDLFEPILRMQYGDNYLAVFADHPWQALLYLNYQFDHKATGQFYLSSRLNWNIYKSMTWDCWFNAQQCLHDHLTTINAKGFNRQQQQSKQAQFKRFIHRVGLTSPWQIKVADANAITRRFGQWMGRIWHWSFTRNSSLEWFPWVAQLPENIPTVTRDIDFPVNHWAYIEMLLVEDFARLCAQLCRDDGEHINRMSWQITLFNYQKISVELSFRHPYSLHRDQPGFGTAIYQAKYVYEHLIQQLQSRDTDLDLPETMPFIGWQLVINERMSLPPMVWELFVNETGHIDYEKITALQNKLPVGFECYQSASNFHPEKSFLDCAIGTESKSDIDNYQWRSTAVNKPLFYYPDVIPIDVPKRMKKHFLERSSLRWWLADDALKSLRDYFVLTDEKGRSSWIYRDSDGDWYKQGEYS